MGTFLTWMQEKEEPVFVLATSNNIDQLPPEMLRKGRFDEIFFVDLPGATTRSEILDIHLKKKGRHEEAEMFDLDRLATASVGYSGAELEEAVKDALFRAFDAGREVEEQDIQEALEATYPLSKTMRETLRACASGPSIGLASPQLRTRNLCQRMSKTCHVLQVSAEIYSLRVIHHDASSESRWFHGE